ncbi:hypothetical protein [Pseudomonas sp. UBA1879]|uniref:hypothetical protein n=1 Tax=Pseudomonas sp. UBA1879 TaxID=1947305 RepID=UPI0025E30770|nr:hypothetical protein [Pseudomonas sp. UBA1879]
MSREWKLVPVEPTENMVINGFESVPNQCFTDEEVWEQYSEMSGCQQAAFRAKLCWAAILAAAPVPPSGGEMEVLAIVTLGSFSAEELGEIDIEPQMNTLERIQRQLVTNEDVSLELVDGAHASRLQTDNAGLQHKLTKANLHCHDLAHKLADKWGSVQSAQFETIKALLYLNEELQQRLTIADQRVDDLQADLAAARELLKHGSLPTPAHCESVLDFLARKSAPAAKIDCANCAFVEGVCSTGCETKRIRVSRHCLRPTPPDAAASRQNHDRDRPDHPRMRWRTLPSVRT